MDFPFAALVGQEQLKTALLLNAVYPAIGGALLRGEKGTAKSTAARSLAALLPPLAVVEGCPFRCDPATIWPECPHCSTMTARRGVELPVPFVDLPLGATEDRVLGTLDFERALREGRRAFQHGLLAGAHRGVLYIDEVNLLPDHLVDVLLDAAASGVNTVQRETVSVVHPARFVLIGTMNPEEGELRPQLLDRFGLMVQVTGPREPAVRAEVVRRRLAFETNPASFAESWSQTEVELRQRISAARDRLPEVVLSDDLLIFISQLCSEVEVDGLRPDLALHKTARARAALEGRTAVSLEDVEAAAELVLPHRRKRRPLQQNSKPPKPPTGGPATDKLDGRPSPELRAGGETEGHFDATVPLPVGRFELATPNPASMPAQGRRNPGADGARGHFVRAVRDEKPADIAIAATIRAAAQRGEWTDGRLLKVTVSDLHRKERKGRTGSLLVFAVDASGSMAARRRMELVKNTVLGLLQSTYEQRDEVAVIAFRGPQAEVILPATRSVEDAERVLRELPTGGRTPLAHALVLAGDVVSEAQRSRPGLPVLLVLLSDGRANVALPGTENDPWQQTLAAAQELANATITALVVDTNAGFVRSGRLEKLAEALGATLLPAQELSAERLVLEL
jgi:magnesium chelatase subunit D